MHLSDRLSKVGFVNFGANLIEYTCARSPQSEVFGMVSIFTQFASSPLDITKAYLSNMPPMMRDNKGRPRFRNDPSYLRLMSNLLLYKVPLLLASAYASHASLSSPNSAPPKSEEDSFGESEPWLSTFMMTKCTSIFNVLHDSAYLGEAAVILALRFPEYALSKHILALLPSHGALRFSPGFLIGAALHLSGAALRILCFRHLGKNFTFELTVRKDHTLTTDGPYAYVRHPSYTGVIAVAIGSALIQMGPGSWWKECCGLWMTRYGRLFAWSWLLIRVWALAAVLLRTGKEDQAMRKTFGEQWDQWEARTPYKVLPGLF